MTPCRAGQENAPAARTRARDCRFTRFAKASDSIRSHSGTHEADGPQGRAAKPPSGHVRQCGSGQMRPLPCTPYSNASPNTLTHTSCSTSTPPKTVSTQHGPPALHAGHFAYFPEKGTRRRAKAAKGWHDEGDKFCVNSRFAHQSLHHRVPPPPFPSSSTSCASTSFESPRRCLSREVLESAVTTATSKRMSSPDV